MTRGVAVGEMKVGFIVTEEGSGSEETENAQTEELGSALLRVGNPVDTRRTTSQRRRRRGQVG
jgi:hypothetical protein